MRDPDRQTTISRVLTGKPSQLSTEKYSQLVQLGKGLDDYDEHNQPSGEGETNLDDEMGVAVVFDESEDDGVESDAEDVVADIAGSSSDEEIGRASCRERV